MQDTQIKMLELKLQMMEQENQLLKEKMGENGKGFCKDLAGKLAKKAGELFEQRDDSLKSELKTFVIKKIFPKCKFPISDDWARGLCKRAWRDKDVNCPPGTTKEKFAEAYYKKIAERLKYTRINSQTSARIKYIGE